MPRGLHAPQTRAHSRAHPHTPLARAHTVTRGPTPSPRRGEYGRCRTVIGQPVPHRGPAANGQPPGRGPTSPTLAAMARTPGMERAGPSPPRPPAWVPGRATARAPGARRVSGSGRAPAGRRVPGLSWRPARAPRPCWPLLRPSRLQRGRPGRRPERRRERRAGGCPAGCRRAPAPGPALPGPARRPPPDLGARRRRPERRLQARPLRAPGSRAPLPPVGTGTGRARGARDPEEPG